jgi:hypothetical protein
LLLKNAGEDNKELWKAHDATELVKGYSGPPLPTLVDTGKSSRRSIILLVFRNTVQPIRL